MTDTTDTSQPSAPQSIPVAASAAKNSQEHLSHLLDQLKDAAPVAPENQQVSEGAKLENELAMVRLGIATSLFFALRTKHVATAGHSLRVALICSAWAEHLGLNNETRDRIEVAALLHDIGKIGIPDRILRKPGRLSVEEQLTMDCCPELACSILRGCTNDAEMLDIVLHSNTWFNTRREEPGPSGEALPLGARMLTIVNAFDAMITEHVYRSGISPQKAIEQLVQQSGTQFDPELVADFSRLMTQSPQAVCNRVANRWLNQFQASEACSHWSTPQMVSRKADTRDHIIRRETQFHIRLLNDLKDGVAFTDTEGTVTHWNGTMVRLTGISSDAIVGKTWDTAAFGLVEQAQNVERSRDGGDDVAGVLAMCPLKQCLVHDSPTNRTMNLLRKGSDPKPVDLQVSPVYAPEGPGKLGAVIILHDKSDQNELEERLETLHHISTLDALTGIANRSHFDTVLSEMAVKTGAGGQRFSLVICDIDFFKNVNDVHGHPAGDEALKTFAKVLSEHSRDGDLVARYGGEEFLLLAGNCDSETASERAEKIRAAVEQTVLPCLGNKSITASFGVTEFQAGDSPETILSRADRALLKAKDSGRNRVVTLGDSNQVIRRETQKRSGWFSWFDSHDDSELEFNIVTPVPASLAIEKLKGFIADHDADVVDVSERQVSLKINAFCPRGGRRRVDQRIALSVRLTLSDVHSDEVDSANHADFTKVHVSLSPIRKRDRRRQEFQPTAELMVESLKSYLMGQRL